MGPLGKMKQSVTHYQFFCFSLLQPPPETLPENEVYFVADNKKTSGWLSFLYSKLTFALLEGLDRAHFLKAENYLFCMKPIVFALVKEANKSYTHGGRRGDLKVTKVHKQQEQVATRGTLTGRVATSWLHPFPLNKQNKTQAAAISKVTVGGKCVHEFVHVNFSFLAVQIYVVRFCLHQRTCVFFPLS